MAIADFQVRRTTGLPVNSDQLDPGTPIAMRLVIRGRDARALWVQSHEMCAIVLNKIMHAIALDHLVGRVFREREHVLRCIVFLLVDSAAFNANGVHEQRN